MQIYVVEQGDTVDSIAMAAGIPAETLVYDNQIGSPYRLAVGQALYIDDGVTMADRRELYVSGYAYPYIAEITLADTLRWLTAIYVFSYGFTREGNLIPPQADDAGVIAAARAAGVRPVLTLTPFGEDGRFNNNLVTVLVRDPEMQRKMIRELGIIMREKGYEGLDIDFEFIQADDREEFAAFVASATRAMNSIGFPVTVALAPKISRDQPGLLYEGVDYRLLGEAANRVLLMTYEWGYTYGPPMAVAPLNMVRRVVDFAVTEIPAGKITLGIPNYGYDWPLPYVRGTTQARTISNWEAVQIAIDHGVAIQFDEVAMSPFFRYWQYGIQHEVWFEDVRSIKAKFELLKEYGLSGVGYWQLMDYFRANWLLLDDMFVIEPGGL